MKKIIIIDDNKFVRVILSDLFEESGFVPLTAEDPDTALRIIETEKPCLVVLDKKLQGYDGVMLLKEIKTINPALPVIMLTGYTDLVYAELAIKEGAYAFINKPFNNEDILATVNNALKLNNTINL